MSSSKPVSSEDIIGQKYDRCLADFLVKTGVGFSVGVVASVILFKRRTFPIALSTGFGAGAAYADCDRSFNPARVPGTRIIPASPSAPAPEEHKHQL
ncbi:hypothetical protein DFH05DRAFT_1485368 [Lentinula detonsa]|uniref:MICOS complex subunit MIC10 n=2 Tax=Lentinula TaxID=5352 RepID=A0A9W8P3Z0_9AGAR|nr:hypothetical protein DFH05DRAFT_1485368 [Lentinula detonsa]KAJ3790100.1 hypothetical protein GGU10DRAFT_341638 [Lentinula aff. detonsa]KAJ3982493.1 hypothetical protein F5890DRAFT_1529619 [Lentinula detonsa]